MLGAGCDRILRRGGGLPVAGLDHAEQAWEAQAQAANDARADYGARRGTWIVRDLKKRHIADKQIALSGDVEREDGRSQHDDRIVALESCSDGAGGRRQKTLEETVALGKAGAAGERRDPDGGVRRLRELYHRIPDILLIDLCSDDKRRPLAAVESLGKRLQQGGIGRDIAGDRPDAWHLRGDIPIVDRDRHESRTTRLLHRRVISSGDGRRDVLGARRLAAPLDVGLRKLGRLLRKQIGMHRQQLPHLLAGGDDHRRLVTERRVDVAERMAEPRRRMQVDEGGLAGRLRIAVGHGDDRRFLETQDVADIVWPGVEERQLGGSGIAEHRVDAEAPQQVERHVFHGTGQGGVISHGRHGPLRL